MRLIAAATSAFTIGLITSIVTGLLPQTRDRVTRHATERRRAWLAQAGLDMTPGQFLLGSVGLGLGAFVLFLLITGVAAVALAPAVLAGLAPRLYYERRRGARLTAVQAAWPDGLRDIKASIAAGMSLQRAVENLTVTGPLPLRSAFQRFPLLARSLGVSAALEAIKADLADPLSDRVIEVLILAHERGGSVVSRILADIADAATADLWTLEAIETESLEQRINARAVFALPWLVLVALTARAGEFRDFYGSTAGLLVVVAGGVLSATGMLLVSRLSREPEEDRVFGGSAVAR